MFPCQVVSTVDISHFDKSWSRALIITDDVSNHYNLEPPTFLFKGMPGMAPGLYLSSIL